MTPKKRFKMIEFNDKEILRSDVLSKTKRKLEELDYAEPDFEEEEVVREVKGPMKKREEKKLYKESKEVVNSRLWTVDERNKFVEAVRAYGKDWTKIASAVESRTKQSVKRYAGKMRNILFFDPDHPATDILDILCEVQPPKANARNTPIKSRV